jgi:hypothetical protein
MALCQTQPKAMAVLAQNTIFGNTWSCNVGVDLTTFAMCRVCVGEHAKLWQRNLKGGAAKQVRLEPLL